MLFALICNDKPDSLALRQATRPEHLGYIETLSDKIKVAGPFTAADGETPNGSMLIVEAPSEADARAIADGDPYAKAGLFESVEVRPWKWVIGNPAG